MSINEKGEFIRDTDAGENSVKKTPEQLEWERRQGLKSEVRRRTENEESLEGLPADVIEEVRTEDRQAKERRRQLREQLSKKQ